MTHPYTGNGHPSGTSQDSPSPVAGGYRRLASRLSYASVVAGLTQNSRSRRDNNEHPAPDTHLMTTTAASNTGFAASNFEPSMYPPRTTESDGSNAAAMATATTATAAAIAAGRRPGTSGAAGTNWSGDSSRYAAGVVDDLTDLLPSLLPNPSYLRKSRYVEQLRVAYLDRYAKMQERAHRKPTMNTTSLSASSSSVNLSKLPATHTHRGVTQDVIERVPLSASSPAGMLSGGAGGAGGAVGAGTGAGPGLGTSSSGGILSEEEPLQLLPSRWSEEDKVGGVEIMADGAEARFNGVTKTNDEAAAVRSDFAMPKECGLFYFEVTILSRGKEGLIAIGFSSRKASLSRLPGWETESWAYHGDDGFVFACTSNGKPYGPRFAAQDVVGCGINFRTGNAFFTKNGNYLGTAFTGIKGDRLYPSVGMKKPSEHLRANFGATPFVFDIDHMMEQERLSILEQIRNTDVSSLHPPDNEETLIQKLVAQYLAHEGYVETAKAFARDVHDRQQALSDNPQPFVPNSDDDDIHAINRQKIRRSILDGDVDRALKFMSSYYPRVLEEERNKDVYFRLRCLKFIEMMRRYNELCVSPSPVAPGSNGHADDEHDAEERQDTQMELDDQLHREATHGSLLKSHSPPPPPPLSPLDDVDMDASQELAPKPPLMKANELLLTAIKYGQGLKEEFGTEQRPAIKDQLTEVFAIMAYTNLPGSPVSYLLNPRGRAEIAEEVNGAILVSLGKPSSAALEKLIAQTEVLLDLTARKTGGAASLINVRRDFLQP